MRPCTLFLVALGTTVWAGADVSGQAQPNIVILLADDLGYADIGVHGCKEAATPHVDSLAKNGIRCTSGYVSGPYCSPTRAALLTGRYQQRFGHEFNPALLRLGGKGQGLAESEVTLAQRLKAAGYATGLVGKWHLGEETQFHPLKRGFSEFFDFLAGAHSYLESDDGSYGPIYRGHERVDFKGYLTDVLAAEAGAFIDRHEREPFFLYLAFNAVHTPMQAPPDLRGQFGDIPDRQRGTYLAMVAGLDRAIGRVLAKLRERKLEQRTLVFFLSDNGGPIGKFASNGSKNTPLRGSKGDTWEGGIRVPFLVQWPGRLPAGKTVDDPVIQLDIATTALTAAGVAVSPDWHLDGVNLLPYLTGETASAPHDALYWRFGLQMAVRQGHWKLVRPDRGKGEHSDIAKEPLLFNLKEDISEQHNLAAQHPDKLGRLQKLWDRWNADLAAPRWPATVSGKVVQP